MALFQQLEQQYGLPSGLLNAVMSQESGGDVSAVSPKGALGAFQFMPATAQELGIDPLNFEQSAEGAARYLKQQLDTFGGDLPMALAAYNAGAGNVKKYGGIPPFKETQDYVSKITGNLNKNSVEIVSNQNLPDMNMAMSLPSDELPEGFVLEDSQPMDELPEGFILESAPETPRELPQQPQQLRKPPTQSKEPWIKGAAQDLGYALNMATPLGALIAAKDLFTGGEQTLPRTIFEKGMQGATSGFSEELASPLAALYATAIEEPSALLSGEIQNPALAQEVGSALEQYRNMLSGMEEQRPVTSALSEIGGFVAPTIASGGTGAGKAITNWLGRGGTGARALKAYMAAIPTTGAYMYGTAEGDLGERAKEVGASPLLYAAAAPAAVIGGAALGKALNKFTSKPSSLTAEEIRDVGSALYKKAEQKGGTLKPEIMDNFIDDVQKMQPQTEIGRALEGESPVSTALNALDVMRGKPLTLEGAKEADEILGNLAYKNVDKFGKIDATGKKFLDMQTTLRKSIEDAPESAFVGGKEGFEAVKDARRFWATQLRMRDIERVIDNAEYYEQPSTAIKTGFRTIMKSEKFSQYTKEEQALIKKAAQTGIVEGGLRLAGSGLVPIIAGTTGAVASGGIGGAASALAGYGAQQAAKKAAEGIRYSKSGKVTKKIMERIPEAQGRTANEIIGMIERGEPLTKKVIDALPQEQKNKLFSSLLGIEGASIGTITTK